jgi:hypothetical protein
MQTSGRPTKEASVTRSETVTESAHSAFDKAIAAIPTCVLDEEGRSAQRDRYARLAPDVKRLEREPEAVVIEFREDFDRQTLDEALAVERACCPFFLFDFDDEARRLRTTVRERDQLPALDAMAYALGATHQARS